MVIDHQGGGEAEQSFYRQENDLFALGNWAPAQQCAELFSRFADRQVQVIGEISHAERLLRSWLL
jgi:hypothetical protein